MALDPSRYAALKADVAAQVGLGTFPDPVSPDAAQAAADYYNAAASPTFNVWETAVKIADLRAVVDIGKYTPTDSPPASTNTTQGTNDALLFNNRALSCQLKQANAFFILQGMNTTLDFSSLSLRQLCADCMTAIPSGASGANQNAGWGTAAAPGAVRLKCMRAARNVEKLFAAAVTNPTPNSGNVTADADGSTTDPWLLTHVGPVTYSDVQAARNSG